MDPALRIVTRLPLTELWDSDGTVAAKRVRDLSREATAGRLASAPVQFIVADVGHTLRWIPPADRYRFWKAEAKAHVVDPAADRFHLDDYPGGYCYRASEWETDAGATVVLLEKSH